MKTHKTPLGAVAHCFLAAQGWLSASQLCLPLSLPLATAPTLSPPIQATGRAQQQGQSGVDPGLGSDTSRGNSIGQGKAPVCMCLCVCV